MQLICIDADFKSEILELFNQQGITIPKLNSIYTVREVFRTKNGTGILLNEIHNPKIPQPSMLGGTFMVEPNWSVKRFTTLQGDDLSFEDLQHINKTEKIETNA